MLIAFLIGVVLIVLGIYVVRKTKRLNKGLPFYAVVYECIPSTMKIASVELPCFEVTLEIPTSQGIIYKTLKHESMFQPGDTIEIYYDEERDQLELAKNVRQNSGHGPYLLIGIGVLWCAIIGMAAAMSYSEAASRFFEPLLVYLLSFIFITVGAYIGIISPYKKKTEMKNCRTVTGYLVDYITKRNSNSATTYNPIYEFSDHGLTRRLKSNISSSGKKYRQIGRQVTIVINDTTGETYCKEDSNSTGVMGLFFLLAGIVFFVVFSFT